MADPLNDAAAAAPVLAQVTAAAGGYLDSLADRPVLDHDAGKLLAGLGGPLPADGSGAVDTIDRLLEIGTAAATTSSGPRFYHLVIGGSTPAALAADWTASLLDQNAYGRVSSPFATEAESVALDWLRELFGLPGRVGRRARGQCDLRQFHLARLRHPVVGARSTAPTPYATG